MILKSWCAFKEKTFSPPKVFLTKNHGKKISHGFLMDNFFLELFSKKDYLCFLKTREIVANFFISKFPLNYNFEIKKTIDRLSIFRSEDIFLQFPDGLGCYSTSIIKTLKTSCFELNDFWIGNRTTYGACCMEDYLGKQIGAGITLHYGHSCLIPVTECMLPIFFVFIEIKFDFSFMTSILKEYFSEKKLNLALVGTIQFASSLKKIKNGFQTKFGLFSVPQVKPLSPGEILGCTSPCLERFSDIFYIGDGRFHLESIILTNFFSRFLQFNPFSQSLNLVGHKTIEIFRERRYMIFKSIFFSKKIGLITGSIGRQGNPMISKKLKEIFHFRNIWNIDFTISEISFDRLRSIGNKEIDTWVQVACPRLSVDWSLSFDKPILTPYEAGVLMRFCFWKKLFYPMDFYSQKSDFWGNYAKQKSFYKTCKVSKKVLDDFSFFYIFYSTSHI